MKKDTVYSMRISKSVLTALKKQAEKERRTVASLLDKIIMDFLDVKGLAVNEGSSRERRRFPRKRITLPGLTRIVGGHKVENLPGVILDLSMNGVLLTYPKGSEIKITNVGELPDFKLQFMLPHLEEKVDIPCHTQRVLDAGSEIQVGATFMHTEDLAIEKLKTYLN